MTLSLGFSFAAVGVSLRLVAYENYVFAAAERESVALAESVVLAVESVREMEEIERYFSALAAVPRIVAIHFVDGTDKTVIASSRRAFGGRPFEASEIAVEAEDIDHALSGAKSLIGPSGVHDQTYKVIAPCLFFGSEYLQRGRSLDSVVIIEISYEHLWDFYGRELLRDGVLLALLIILSALGVYYFVNLKVLKPVSSLRSRFFDTAEKHGFVLDPELVAEGELDSLIDYHRYVTERLEENERKLKNALREARKLAQISERTRSGIIVANSRGEVEWVNKGFERISGYSLSDVQGKRPGHILQGTDSSPETVQLLREALRDQKPIKVDIRNYRKTGEPYWVRLDIEPLLDDDGVLDSYIGLQYDIGAEKEREAAILEAKEAAESLTLAKLNFLSVISHEIRTPLNGIIGMIELLKEGKLDEEQKELVGIANACSRDLLILINDVLDFSKIESGCLVMDLAPIDLRKIAQTVYEGTRRAAREKVSYNWKIDPEISQGLMGDSTRVAQLLLNLCSNALKFTKEGKVDLEIEFQRRDANEEIVEIVVRDTGVGIEPDKMKMVLEPFTQAQNSMTREFGGAGLGLTVCRRICDSMRAELTLESRVGEGTTARVRIPFAVAKKVIL